MAKHNEWSEELEADLAAPFPVEWQKQKSMGGQKVIYVAWHRYVSKLNSLVGGGWSMGTPVTMHVGEKLCMGLPITILGVTRVNWGDEDDSEWEEIENKQTGEVEEKKTMYGSPITNSYAQAFKRTCALFGLGLYLYEKGAPKSPGQSGASMGGGSAAQRLAPPGDPAWNASGPPAPQTARDAFSLDSVAPGKKANGRTWRQLLQTEEGRGFVTWALDKMTTMSPAQRTALTEAMSVQAPKASATDAILLENELNKAASLGVVSDDQERRIRGSLEKQDADEVRIALDWLQTQIQKKKLAGADA